MTQRRKRVEKILRRPTRMTFAEVEKILEDFGMQLYRTKGSHSWFKGAMIGQICVPKSGGRWVEEVYLDEVCRLLNLDDVDLDQLDSQ